MNNSKIRLGISLRIVEEINYEEKRDALSHDWLTLIENLEGPFIEDDLFIATSTINERISECKDESTLNLLQSLLSVIQQFESKIEI